MAGRFEECNIRKIRILCYFNKLINIHLKLIVSELLGHSNMKIAQEYYGKIVLRKMSEEILTLTKKQEH